MIHNEIARELEKGTHLSITELVNLLIKQAQDENTSDIHIDPAEHYIQVQFRIDGKLYEKYRLPKEYHISIISRIKILAKLRTDEHQAPQDGRFRTYFEKDFTDIRVSIVPTYYGENAVLRLLKNHLQALSLLDLKFSERDYKCIEKVLSKHHGMILTTGPTGSGKTTTLYSLLKYLNNSTRSIITIEDPIEYAIEGVRHIQVNPQRNLSFAQGLRAIVRQDPDIIMVGEIRDIETAHIAIHTALTGHMLLSTLHTIDAATALPRLLDMNIESYLVASTVDIVIGQRLVRKLCDACKKQKIISGSSMFEAVGCSYCNNTGYKGRMSIYEILEMTPEIQQAVMNHSPSHVIKNLAQKSGMTTMYEDGMTKVLQGYTSMQEIISVFHD